MSHTDIKLIKKIVFTTFHDSSSWLKAQSHNQVFWKFLENTSLYDSDVCVFNRLPLGFENHQTSLNKWCQLVSIAAKCGAAIASAMVAAGHAWAA